MGGRSCSTRNGDRAGGCPRRQRADRRNCTVGAAGPRRTAYRSRRDVPAGPGRRPSDRMHAAARCGCAIGGGPGSECRGKGAAEVRPYTVAVRLRRSPPACRPGRGHRREPGQGEAGPWGIASVPRLYRTLCRLRGYADGCPWANRKAPQGLSGQAGWPVVGIIPVRRYHPTPVTAARKPWTTTTTANQSTSGHLRSPPVILPTSLGRVPCVRCDPGSGVGIMPRSA